MVTRQALNAQEQRGRVAVRLSTLDRRPRDVNRYRRSLAGIGALCLESYREIGAFAEQMTRRLEAEASTGNARLRSLRLLEASIPGENLRRLDECSAAFTGSIRR